MFALQISNDFFFNFFYSFEISALGKNLIEIPCRLSFSLNKMSKNDYHIRLSVQSGNFLLISDDSDVPLVDAKVDTLGTVPVVEDWLSYGWTPGMDISTVHNEDGSITIITADEATLEKKTENTMPEGGGAACYEKIQVVESDLKNYWSIYDQESSTDFMRALRAMSTIELQRFFKVLLRIQQGITRELDFRILNFKNPKITTKEVINLYCGCF